MCYESNFCKLPVRTLLKRKMLTRKEGSWERSRSIGCTFMDTDLESLSNFTLTVCTSCVFVWKKLLIRRENKQKKVNMKTKYSYNSKWTHLSYNNKKRGKVDKYFWIICEWRWARNWINKSTNHFLSTRDHSPHYSQPKNTTISSNTLKLLGHYKSFFFMDV